MKTMGSKLWWLIIGLALIGALSVVLAPLVSRHRQFVARLRPHEILLGEGGILRVSGLIRHGMVMSAGADDTGKTEEGFAGLEVVYSGPYPSRNGRLSASDLSELRTAIRELPVQSVSPPPERLVFVSYKDGVWHTRTYDRDALPQAVERIHQLFERSFRPVRTNSATNKRPAVDAGMGDQFAIGRPWSGTTEAER